MGVASGQAGLIGDVAYPSTAWAAASRTLLTHLRVIVGGIGAELHLDDRTVLARCDASGFRSATGQSMSVQIAGDLWLTIAFGADASFSLGEADQRKAAIASLVRDWLMNADPAPPADREVMLDAAIEHNDCGIVGLDLAGRILFSNAAADAILAERDGIELRRDGPRPTNYRQAVRFQEALDSIIAPRASGGRAHAMILLLERKLHDRPLISVLAPLMVDQRAAGAVVYLSRPEGSVARGLETICHLHGLSPVETQLVGHLMSGLTVIETAAAMRVKADTARTYLKQVFVKTDTHRQTELLQLMLRYQRAVRGNFAFLPG